MHTLKGLLALAIALFLSTTSFAQNGAQPTTLPDIVVTGNLTPYERESSPYSVTVVSKEEIEQKNAASVTELISALPALSFSSSGANVAEFGIRGGATRYTLILIDGVPYTDPSGLSGFAAIGLLPPSIIERIEVVSGPASAMYGSGAMGGVINLITKKKAPTEVYAGGGSYSSYKVGAHIGTPYALAGASYYREKGVSMADKNTSNPKPLSILGGDEADGYYMGSLFLVAPLELGKFEQRFTLIKNQSYIKSDYSAGVDLIDDDGQYAKEDSQFLAYTASIWVGNIWKPQITLSATDTYRFYHNYASYLPSGYSDSNYSGHSLSAELSNLFNIADIAAVRLGGKLTGDKASNQYLTTSPWPLLPTATSTTREAFLNVQAEPVAGLNLMAGGRYTDIDSFSSRATYSGGAAYTLAATGTTFKGSYGTGYRVPALNQLNDPQYGNKQLKGEYSEGYEAGIFQKVGNTAYITAVYFSTLYDDKISGSPTGWYNTDADSKGAEVEAGISYSIAALTAGYTYAKTSQHTSGTEDRVLRRPENKARGMLTLTPVKNDAVTGSLSLEAVYTAKVNDIGYNNTTYVNEEVTLPAYTLLNLYVNCEMSNGLSLYVKGLNLTDKHYQTVYGYGTKGLDIQGGEKYSF